jgi:hypothetical protein
MPRSSETVAALASALAKAQAELINPEKSRFAVARLMLGWLSPDTVPIALEVRNR